MPFTCCGGGEGLLWKERVGTPPGAAVPGRFVRLQAGRCTQSLLLPSRFLVGCVLVLLLLASSWNKQAVFHPCSELRVCFVSKKKIKIEKS